MSSRNRWLLISGLVGGIFFLLGLLWTTQAPRVRNWALVKINQVSEQDLPVRLLPTSIDLHLFPLGATVNGVRILPKPEVAEFFDPLTVDSVRVELSLLQLAQGRLWLREILLQGAHGSIRIPKQKPSQKPPLEGLFKAFENLPIDRLEIKDVALKLELAQPRIRADLQDIRFICENTSRGIGIDLSIGSTHVKDEESAADVRVNANIRALLAPTSVTISELKIRRGESTMVASGIMKGNTEALKFPKIEVNSRASLHLESMRNWLVRTTARLSELPEIKGRAEIDTTIRGSSDGIPVVDFKVSTDGLYEKHFFIDKISAAGTYRQGVVRIPKFEFKNPGADAIIRDIEIRSAAAGAKSLDTNEPEPSGTPPQTAPPGLAFKAHGELKHGQLHEFLKTLGLKEAPVFVDASGTFPCEGTITPIFRINCKGELFGKKVFIHDRPTVEGSIVAIPEFSAKGEFSAGVHEVTFKTDLKMPKSSGRAKGVVNYETGFKIEYEGDAVNFADAANISGLKLEGVAKIKGRTDGNASAATLKMDMDVANGWLDNYGMGQIRGEVTYKSGILAFNKLNGHYTTTRYSGNASIDVHNKTIKLDGKIPFFDARDMMEAFSRRVKLPIAVTGTGKGDIKLWGPLAFTKLSYNLHTTMFRGTIAGEPFDEAHFDIHAKDGTVTADRVLINRGQQTITLTGNGYPNGDIKTVVHGRDIRLEESATVAGLGMSLSGQVNFDMDLTGYVLGPLTDLHGTISKSAIGDQGVPDSNFRLRFTSKTIEGGGEFLGDVLKARFVFPLNPQAPFAVDIKTHDLNYAPIFAAISGPGTRKDYDGRLSSDISLSSPSGGFWKSSGKITIEKFLLSRGALQMQAPKPLRLSMNQGHLVVDSFYLEGDGTFLRANENPNPVSNIDVQVNGKLDMSLLALALPFFEELRGTLSSAFNIRAGPNDLSLLGSVYVDKGYLKLFSFPHPFEDIKGDFLFSQKKVLINSLRAELAGGKVTADGTVELKGYKNIPIQISAMVDKVNLNIPDGMLTNGSGHLSFSGSWFPFLMKGNYDIRSGLITRQFGGNNAAAGAGIQRSAFLPRMLLEESFSPITMDISVDTLNPIDLKCSIGDSLVEGKGTGRFSLKGPPANLSILGTANAERESKVTFRENIFDILVGRLNFNDPNELNPQIYVNARSRVSEYDVNLVVQGYAKKPVFNLSSSPPLAEPELISLLALGVPNDANAKNQSGSSALSISGGLIKNNPVTETLKQRTGIEVDVSTGFDDTNNVAVPKITGSRKVTRNLGLSASRSLESAPRSDAKVHYQLSNRFSIVGSWEGQDRQENSSVTGKTQDAQDKMGLDFEYKFEFK